MDMQDGEKISWGDISGMQIGGKTSWDANVDIQDGEKIAWNVNVDIQNGGKTSWDANVDIHDGEIISWDATMGITLGGKTLWDANVDMSHQYNTKWMRFLEMIKIRRIFFWQRFKRHIWCNLKEVLIL